MGGLASAGAVAVGRCRSDGIQLRWSEEKPCRPKSKKDLHKLSIDPSYLISRQS